MRLQGQRKDRSQVVLDDENWVGHDVLVIGSKHIFTGCIIAARTVLVKDFLPYSIIGGNPSFKSKI